MAEVSLLCTSCRRQISFDPQYVGSIQQCPHCGQQVIVPNAASANSLSALAVQAAPVVPVTPIVERQAQYVERAQEAQTSRRLKMGSGCFAMLAVMFAVGLVGTGVGILTEVDEQKLFGLSAVIGGLAGLAAFVFFGYIATETASSSSDRGRS